MLPGMGQIRDQIENIDEREIDRVAALIKSMTPAERRDHKILNGSRRARIARGAGATVADVNGLVDRFAEAQKMMRQMASGGGMPGMPGLPGMPGVPGMGRGKKAKGKAAAKGGKKAKGGRSGNPAKRALEERQAADRLAGVDGPSGLPDLPADFELPDELRDLLPPTQR
jgi:signal recognition particle subunit SRP54